MKFDYVIVGGGSAGCVLAHRLSANGRCRVLLLEAGPDILPDAMPEDVRDPFPNLAQRNPAYLWNGLEVSQNVGDAPSLRFYEQARVLGGGSSINSMLANRGYPSDYDEWAAGAEGWAWDQVLPFFCRLERDEDFEGPLHGLHGPISIRRPDRRTWTGFTAAVTQVLDSLGYHFLADQNTEYQDGYFPVAVNLGDEARISTATAYLDAPTRQRPNLVIKTSAPVDQIVFSQRTAVGVRIAESREMIGAKTVIVAAGAIHSPTLLMRSGVGPAAILQRIGSPVVSELPGCGRNLLEHPVLSLATYIRRPAARLFAAIRYPQQIAWRYSSGVTGCPQGDMAVAIFNRVDWHALGERFGSLNVRVNKSYSRGWVEARSLDWRVEPRVELQLLSDRRDLIRMMDGVRQVLQWRRLPHWRQDYGPFFFWNASPWARALHAPTLPNRMTAAFLGAWLDDATGADIVGEMLGVPVDLASLASDDVGWEATIRQHVRTIWHPCGTCRMGPSTDPAAVVDSRGRVHGVQGLRVIDASVMPTIPCANTNIPTIMIAEKMAAALAAEAG